MCLEGSNTKHLPTQNKFTLPGKTLYLIPVANLSVYLTLLVMYIYRTTFLMYAE